MSVFKQVDFSKIYAGNLPNGQHYCNWFAEYENENAIESINSNAFGLYSADAFGQCQQQNAIGGSLSRYNETETQIVLDFKRIKRNSNFLIPIILGYGEDRVLNISVSDSTEQDNNKLYTIGVEEDSNKILSSYNINHEITQSFLLDSFIITGINENNSSISSFSIFNDTTSLITYFISNDDSTKTISLLVEPQQNGVAIEKKYLWNDLRSNNYTFYKYNIPFNAIGDGELNNARLEEFNPSSLQELIDEVKTGTIYISKNDLGYNNLTNPIKHPNYILSKIKFNYFNPLRNTVIDSQVFQIVGNTNNCINFFKFFKKNNEDMTQVLKYQLNINGMRLNAISENNTSGDFISVENNTSKYYYAGGILFGWTTNKGNYFNLIENKIVLQQEEDLLNDNTLFNAGENINDNLKDFYTHFYVPNDGDNSYFYFSNNKNKADLSTIDNTFVSKEINLYPVYLDDPNYITPVVEITNQSENIGNDTFVSLTESGLKQLIDNTKKYPVIDINTIPADQWASVSDGQPSIEVIHGSDPENPKYVKVGSNITFDDSQKILLDYTETVDTQLNNNFNYYYQDENEEYILIETQEELDTAIGNEKTIYKKSIDQKLGSFRVNVNTDTFEVPVKGIEDVKVKNAGVADYYTESNGEKSELTIAEKFLKTGPVLLENQIIIISKPEEEAALENGNVIEYIIPQDIEVTRNSIVMITPVIADSPNEDLQIEEEPYNSSSWDIWAGCGITCVQDPNYPRRIYFYLNEAIQDPELEESSTIENPKIKIAINLAIFQNGIIHFPIPNENSGSGGNEENSGSGSGESGSGESSGNTSSGDLPDLTTFDPTTDFRSFSYVKNNNGIDETITNKNFNEAVEDGICALERNGDYWDFKILKDCSFTVNKDISTTVFMVGGGGSGGRADLNISRETTSLTSNPNEGQSCRVQHYQYCSTYGGRGGNGGYILNQNKDLLNNNIITITIGQGGNNSNGNETILQINNNENNKLIANGGEQYGEHNMANGAGKGGNHQARYTTSVVQQDVWRYYQATGWHYEGPGTLENYDPIYATNVNSNMDGQQGILYHGNYYGAGGGGGGANQFSNTVQGWIWHNATFGKGGNNLNNNEFANGDGGVYNNTYNNGDLNNHDAKAGAPNTGNGGGGGYTVDAANNFADPGAGGSGIVIISNYV